MSKSPIDWRRLRQLADRQASALTRPQCLQAGMPPAAIKWRVASGRWQQLHPGVYGTAPGADDWRLRSVACLLAALTADPVARVALGREAAAQWWGLASTTPRTIDLVVPCGRHIATPRGARIRRIDRWDRVVHDTEFPWRTTIRETVLDMAASGSQDHALATVSRAIQEHRTTAEELRHALLRRQRMRHRGILLEALHMVGDGAHSAAETRFARDVIRAHHLPGGTAQDPSVLGGGRAHDVGFRPWGLVVEIDGRLGHETWSDRVRDGRRERGILVRGGLTTLHYFWADVATTPCVTAKELAGILHDRGWPGQAVACRRLDCALRRTP